MGRMKQLYNGLLSPKAQVRTAWLFIIFSIVGWPISALTVARAEPPVILAISWLALLFSGYSSLVAARADKHIREK